MKNSVKPQNLNIIPRGGNSWLSVRLAKLNFVRGPVLVYDLDGP